MWNNKEEAYECNAGSFKVFRQSQEDSATYGVSVFDWGMYTESQIKELTREDLIKIKECIDKILKINEEE